MTMERPATDQANTRRVGLLVVLCLLIAVVGLLRRPSSLPPTPAAAEPATEQPSTEKAAASVWGSGEPRVTFAHTMPRTHGTQIFNNTGRPNLEMVMVAIPDGPKSVRFVRGSDPEAVRYLEAASADQERVVEDHGPRDVDTSEIADFGPLKGRTARRIGNLVPQGK